MPNDIVRTFAPLLRLDADERHFPDDPENFGANCRFRQSNYSGRKDRGWNKQLQKWEDTNDEGDEYTGEKWDAIVREIGKETATLRPGGITTNGPIAGPSVMI